MNVRRKDQRKNVRGERYGTGAPVGTAGCSLGSGQASRKSMSQMTASRLAEGLSRQWDLKDVFPTLGALALPASGTGSVLALVLVLARWTGCAASEAGAVGML